MDVNHAFNIPDLTVMMDAVPGRINTVWVMPDATGEYLIQCREYCGFSHYQMRAKLFVEDETTPVAVDQAAEKLVPASLTVDSKNSAPVS
jgi:cytochrome c oxidase subunit 2